MDSLNIHVVGKDGDQGREAPEYGEGMEMAMVKLDNSKMQVL